MRPPRPPPAPAPLCSEAVRAIFAGVNTRPHTLVLLALLVVTSVAHAQFVAPQVVFELGTAQVAVVVELARTPDEQARGLMFRRELQPYAGMLFLYDRDARHSFWMKNTYVPLDMLFIDAKGIVVGIVENAEPVTLTSRAVDVASRHVLEVNAGFCRQHGIKVGTRVKYLGIANLSSTGELLAPTP